MGCLTTLLGGFITGDSLYPKKYNDDKDYVLLVGGLASGRPWSCNVSISGLDEDVGVQLITLPTVTKRNRIANRLDDRIEIRNDLDRLER